MQVTVSRVSPVEVELHVALPRDRVHTALERAYSELGRHAQIRGFRKGKVPRSLLRQYFGDKVATEVAKKLVEETLPGALRDQKLEPLNQPRVASETDLTGTEDWAYTAHMEVRPEIVSMDLGALQLKRRVYQIDEHDVDHVVERKREENATLRTPEPARPVQADDAVTVDIDLVLEDGVHPEYAARGRTVEAGRGKLFKELDAALIGMGVGETREVAVNFPETHRQEALRGQAATFRVTVVAVQEKVMPELDDDFARDCGKEGLAALRDSIRQELERDYSARSRDELRNDAVEALVRAHPVAVPPSLVEQVIEQMRPEVVRSFQARGEEVPAGLEGMLRAEASDRVRAGLLLTEIARTHGLGVTDAELGARLEQMAAERGKAVQKLRVEYRDAQKRELLISSMLEDKVIELLLAKSTITDEPTPTHSHAHGEAAGEGQHASKE